jgi:DNA repair exonuclease SbcCD ATPase subunit
MSDSTDMLELLELRMRNFLSYGNNYTVVDLTTPGTTLIVGEDLDSGTGSANGVGKTTILNGIVYGFYDKPLAKEIKLDKLINNINKKNMEVHLKFRKYGDTFVVSRYRKGKDGNTVVLTKNGVAVTRDSVDQTNQYIESIIGYSYDLFVRIVVFSAGHDAFLDLPTSGAKKPTQSDIMEELFDLTSLTEKAERAKKEIKATEQRMEVIKAQIEQIEREAERHATQIDNTKRMIGEWETGRQSKIARLRTDLAKLEGIDFEREQALHKQLKELMPKANTLRNMGTRYQDWSDQHELKTIRVMKELKKLQGIDFDAQLELYQRLDVATKQKNELETVYNRYQGFHDTITRKCATLSADIHFLPKIDFEAERMLHLTLAEKQTALKTLNTELEDIVRVKGENLMTYEVLSKESKHLFDATCPYCLQNFAGAKEKGEVIDLQLGDISSGLKQQDTSISKKNAAISALAEEIAKIKDSLSVKSLVELTKLQGERENLEQRYADALSATNPHEDTLFDLIDVAEPTNEMITAAYDARIANLVVTIALTSEQITVDEPSQLSQMKADHASLTSRFAELESESNPYTGDIERLLGTSIAFDGDVEQTIEKHVKDLSQQVQDILDQITVDDIEQLLETKNNSSTMELRVKELSVEVNPYEKTLADLEAVKLDDAKYDHINEMVKTVEHHKFLVKLLTKSDSFVRKKLIEENIPFLNKQLRENLKDLGLPHRVEFTNTMTASVSQMGRELDFANLSRGQKARVNLAVAWAFHDVLQSMHGPVNFCLLDEVLDVGLCSVGVIMAAKMLKNRARRDKLTMFIISHKEEVNSVFDRTMKIQLHKGFSKIATE